MDLQKFFSSISKKYLTKAEEALQELEKSENFHICEIEPTYRFFHHSFKMVGVKDSITMYIDILLTIFGINTKELHTLNDRIEKLKELQADSWWVTLLEQASKINIDTLYGASRAVFIDAWKTLSSAFYTTKIICIATVKVLRKIFQGKIPGLRSQFIDYDEGIFFYIWVPEWRYTSSTEIIDAIHKSSNKELIEILNKILPQIKPKPCIDKNNRTNSNMMIPP